ncbi:MAG: hypothetical protein IKN83_04175 [Bacteroidaceae bacterium]|nr:hypothetical protein [Bacteroidaceae bacterium]
MKKTIWLAMMLFCMETMGLHAQNTDISTLDNAIYVESQTVEAGSQVVLSVKLKNSISVRDFQFSLYLPEGMSFAKDDEGWCLAELTPTRLSGMKTFEAAIQEDGSLLVLCYSLRSYVFSGTDGEVCTITINVDENITPGNHTASIKNIELTETSSTSIMLNEVNFTLKVGGETVTAPLALSCDQKGSVEVNGVVVTADNKAVNVASNAPSTFVFTPNEGNTLAMVKLNGEDVTSEVVNNSLTLTIPEGSYMMVAFDSSGGTGSSLDVNQDGYVDISDVVFLVNYILNH